MPRRSSPAASQTAPAIKSAPQAPARHATPPPASSPRQTASPSPSTHRRSSSRDTPSRCTSRSTAAASRFPSCCLSQTPQTLPPPPATPQHHPSACFPPQTPPSPSTSSRPSKPPHVFGSPRCSNKTPHPPAHGPPARTGPPPSPTSASPRWEPQAQELPLSFSRIRIAAMAKSERRTKKLERAGATPIRAWTFLRHSSF